MSAARPPRLAEYLLAAFLPRRERDEVVGDMAERYARRTAARGRRLESRVWYWRQTALIPARLLWRRRGSLGVAHELRYAARGLRRSPAFATVAILSLALGIGANTALYSTVRALLMTPLPVESPDELVFVYHQRPQVRDVRQLAASAGEDPETGAAVHSNFSYPIFEAFNRAVEGTMELSGFNFVRSVSVVVEDRPALAASAFMVSGDFFSTLRLGMLLGRGLQPEDDRIGAPGVAVISHAFWQRVYGGDPDVLERRTEINGVPFDIVGVTGPRYVGLSPGGFVSPSDVTVPLTQQPVVAPRWSPELGSMFTSDDHYWVRGLARVPTGSSVEAVREQLSNLWRGALIDTGKMDAELADEAEIRFLPARRGLDSLRSDTQRPLTILAFVVGAVLLIACVNLASLSLARGAARKHELAVRRALGAGRLRLIRQVLLESLLLAICGGGAGLWLALWSGPALTAALTAGLGRVAIRFEFDWTLLATVAGVTLVAALACGLFPALRLTRDAVHAPLTTRGDAGGANRTGRVLIALQIAVSAPLLVGAGLFLQTVGNLNRIDPGFATEDVVIFGVDTALVAPERASQVAMYEEILRATEQIPGVLGATLVENVLISGWMSNTGVDIDGEVTMMHMQAVGPNYFETFGIPLHSGRLLQESDDATAPRVVLVNAAAEQQLFGGHAVGRTILIDETAASVVGVVADTKYNSLRAEVPPTFFDPYQQRGSGSMFVAVRSSLPVSQLEPTLRATVAAIHSGLPLTGLRTQSAQIATATSRERVFARLLALFGAFALLIACIGLYGVTAFAVTRQRAELGVRLALGARPNQILWMVVRQVIGVTGAGLAIGLVGAYWVGPLVGSMLYGVQPTDPTTLAGAAATMLAVALVAGWIPARAAARTDALVVLSDD